MGRLARQGLLATTSGSAVRGLWGDSFEPSQFRFRRLASSHGLRRRRRTGDFQQGRRSVSDNNQEGKWTAPLKNVPLHRNTAEDISMI